MLRKYKFHWSHTRMVGSLHEDRFTLFIISHSFLCRKNIFWEKVVEKIETYLVFSITYFWKLHLYDIMWENVVEPGRHQMTVWHMHLACWIPKATNTYWDYVTFPLHQWLHEHASMLVICTWPVLLWIVLLWTLQYDGKLLVSMPMLEIMISHFM